MNLPSSDSPAASHSRPGDRGQVSSRLVRIGPYSLAIATAPILSCKTMSWNWSVRVVPEKAGAAGRRAASRRMRIGEVRRPLAAVPRCWHLWPRVTSRRVV